MNVIAIINLPGVARSAPEARDFVKRIGTHLRLERSTIADIALCVDELFANAYEHTASGRGGRVSITVAADSDAVRVTVTDDGGASTKPCVHNDMCGEGEDGRGLLIVEALSEHWGVDHVPHGTAVWINFSRTSCP